MDLYQSVKTDMARVIEDRTEEFAALDGRTVLLTGATGLIGFNLMAALTEYAHQAANPPHIVAVIRNREKADRLFSGFDLSQVEYLTADVRDLTAYAGNIDYLIHAASETASRAFVETPVETIRTALDGTQNLLKIAAAHDVKSFVYLSSMEVYGSPATDEKISETHPTNLDTMAVRSSYPESKRMCEALCSAYASEYRVPAKVIRLTQTFGPGVFYEDGRVFAEFARCALEGRDIVLHTKGETKRSYLYTADAVSAILTVLLRGETGAVYNAANEDTYCSIREMADLAAREIADGRVSVRIEEEDAGAHGYAPVLHMNLDTAKLRGLDWRARTNLPEMFRRLAGSMIRW